MKKVWLVIEFKEVTEGLAPRKIDVYRTKKAADLEAGKRDAWCNVVEKEVMEA